MSRGAAPDALVISRPIRLARGPFPAQARDDAFGWLALVACVVLSWWVHRRCLGVYFAPDDLILLERVQHLVRPYPVPFWRMLSGSGYFALAWRSFGADPYPYHLVNMLLHALNVALLFVLARRWSGSALAATLAAGSFGVSRLYTTALLQSVGIEELLALALTLVALLAFDPRRHARVLLSVSLFAGALLAKESVLLVPLVLVIAPVPGGSWRQRGVGVAALMGVGIAYLAAFIAERGTLSVSGGEAYATHYGTNLFHNLMTYVGWIANLRDATPDLAGRVSFTAWRTAVAVTASLLALAMAAGASRPAAWAGLAWFVLALIPVLAYLHHSYFHYTYPALPGVTIAIGSAVASWIAAVGGRLGAPVTAIPRPAARSAGVAPVSGATRRRGRLEAWVPWAIVGVLVLAQAAISERITSRRWSTLIPGTELAEDPALRKTLLARHVVETIAPTLEGRGVRLMFLVPREATTVMSTATGQTMAVGPSTLPNLLVSVLDDGRALRAVFPQLDSVAFAPRWGPGYRDFDLVATTFDGFAIDFGRGPLAHVRLARALVESGNAGPALADLDAAIAAYPEDTLLVRARARLLAAVARRVEQARLAETWAQTAAPPGPGSTTPRHPTR